MGEKDREKPTGTCAAEVTATVSLCPSSDPVGRQGLSSPKKCRLIQHSLQPPHESPKEHPLPFPSYIVFLFVCLGNRNLPQWEDRKNLHSQFIELGRS